MNLLHWLGVLLGLAITLVAPPALAQNSQFTQRDWQFDGKSYKP